MNAFSRLWPKAAPAIAPVFGRRVDPQPFSLLVDLSAEPLGALWCRGAATLALLCSAAIMLAPAADPFGALSEPAPAAGGEMKLMAFTPLADAPAPHAAAPADAGLPAIEPARVATEGDAVRVSGSVSDGLYWSLREAGVSPRVAAEYLKILATRIDVGVDVAPFDRFDLVVAKGHSDLLYAALHRAQGDDVQLLKWKSGWLDADGETKRRSDQMMAPVEGRITSRFGRRVHPILRFSRMHSGIDFGARTGSPIVAAADGQVVAAGWAGGYGRQVRVAHGGGIVTTYSHMSSFAAAPGTPVRQGEVIGYVGSSGMSTGPHLHFEVRVGGRAVDPLSVRLAQKAVLEGRERAAFQARLRQLTAIGERAG